MKTIGLIGGMSWESTQHYYQLMNRYTHAKLGGHNSTEAIIYSVNFEKILTLVHRNEWEAVGKEISHLAKKLEIAGADFLILTANAIHKVFSQVEAAINIPILHIVDPTAEAIREARIKTVGLLGTKVTMEEQFYKDRLLDRFGIDALVPERHEREILHNMIFDELTVGKINESSRKRLVTLIEHLGKKGAKGIILGCTELTLLINQKDSQIPLFDTTELHARAAVDLAFSK
ncbi:MAG: aspartate/glutamate racemase family protein [Verrucomicrobia bacterium]|nr:aspartate/glutamate racemase family protein [Verrucomicrobiota bacterium]